MEYFVLATVTELQVCVWLHTDMCMRTQSWYLVGFLLSVLWKS